MPRQQIAKLGVQYSFGRADAKLIAIRPQLNALLRQQCNQLVHVRNGQSHRAISSMSSPILPGSAVAILASVNGSSSRLTSCAKLVAPTKFCNGISTPKLD